MTISKRAQRIANRQVIDGDAMSAAHNDIIELMHDAPTPDFAEIATFKREMNDWLWERKDVLDYYKLVDEINASIHQATDKQAKMDEWRAWATEMGAAIDKRDNAQDALNKLQKSNTRGTMGHAFAVEAHAGDLDDAQAIIDRLKDGPVKVEPKMAQVDEQGQRFDDDSYLPF